MIVKFIAIKIIQACEKYGNNKRGTACSFGDQRVVFSKDWLLKAVDSLRKGYALGRESDNGLPLMPIDDFFKALGFSDYFDIDYNGKARLCLDLGKPIPKELYCKADILYDGGVIEHIPNIFQAMSNAMLLLKKDGILVQAVPVASFSGGTYYNIEPLLLRDLYGANGFEMVECLLFYSGQNKMDKMQYFRSYFNICKNILKSKIRPLVPKTILKRRKMEYECKLEEYKKMRKYDDNLDNFSFINPFDPIERFKMKSHGLPSNTHVIYIGIKRRDIDPENIAIPTQADYPSAIASGTK